MKQRLTLRHLRENAGLSIEQVSEHRAIPATLIANYEEDSTRIPPSILYGLAQMYNVADIDTVYCGYTPVGKIPYRATPALTLDKHEIDLILFLRKLTSCDIMRVVDGIDAEIEEMRNQSARLTGEEAPVKRIGFARGINAMENLREYLSMANEDYREEFFPEISEI